MDANNNKQSRRDAIKTAGKFVIPTLVTFQLTELKAHASFCGEGSHNVYSWSGDHNWNSYFDPETRIRLQNFFENLKKYFSFWN